ncbi:Aste57867_16538 [Aphanomyces stellatus]|uniref:Aste57867_16538 protein n=1 Tax=Aphanomyces stellatus TaxID=120398 RepID=A0A485L8U6_9STRA|nr:hypothetical protein As57867_016481 [Aphanomyces stellatus]VFT93312.1 Aste57867_16538 [Aphanomyces stellatus]
MHKEDDLVCPSAWSARAKQMSSRAAMLPSSSSDDGGGESTDLLKSDVSDYQAQVDDRHAASNDVPSAMALCKRKWSWCEVAKAQQKDAQECCQEQKRLKWAVGEHMDLLASLQEMMKTSQRLCLEEWKCNRLPQDATSWKQGILNMLTRDYERLDTMLIRNDLVDATTNLCKTVVRRGPDGAVTSIDKVTHLRLSCHLYDDVVKIMNALVLTEKGRECLVKGTKWDALELVERMEHDAMYIKCKAKCLAGAVPWLQGQVAVKRFVEPSRVVFVVRSVLEDARHPLPQPGETCYPHDEVGWFVVERKAVCAVKSIVSCTPPPPAAATAACAVSRALQSVHTWFRSCVNIYRQQNRSVTELFVHALCQRFRPLVVERSPGPPPISSAEPAPEMVSKTP